MHIFVIYSYQNDELNPIFYENGTQDLFVCVASEVLSLTE